MASGGPPSDAPTFGLDSDLSVGSSGGSPIRANTGGATLQVAAPCASEPISTSGSQPVGPDAASVSAPDVANAVRAAGVVAMTAAAPKNGGALLQGVQGEDLREHDGVSCGLRQDLNLMNSNVGSEHHGRGGGRRRKLGKRIIVKPT